MASLQIRLDRCVGSKALDLKRLQDRIELSNKIILINRAAIAAATIAPPAIAAMKILLQAEALAQDLLLAGWKIQQARWLANRGCDGLGEFPTYLPSPGWSRLPPDSIGPQALRLASDSRRMRIQLQSRQRKSAALISKGEGGNDEEGKVGEEASDSWKARWTEPNIEPFQMFRTSSR